MKEMTIYSVYDQIAVLLSGLDPAKVVALKPTEEAQKRFETLVKKKHNQTLDEMEKDELDHFVVLERLMRRVKMKKASDWADEIWDEKQLSDAKILKSHKRIPYN
jgi:hypothetical protein